MNRALIALGLICCFRSILFGQEIQDTVPSDPRWHVRAQFAGYQGLISVGGGPILAKGAWKPGLMYGFAPTAGGREAVHQIIVRNDLIFLSGRQRSHSYRVFPTMSVNLMIETGRHSFLKLPDRFPKGYYYAPQLHGTLGSGALVSRTLPQGSMFRTVGLGAEVVGLDTYIWYAISQRGIPLHQAFGLSLSAAAAF